MIVLNGNQLSGKKEVGYGNVEREKILTDPKRKRIDDVIDGENIGIESEILMETQTNEPKNLQLAGPVAQARQGL